MGRSCPLFSIAQGFAFAALTAFALLASALAARAVPVFYQWGGEKIEKVVDFPDQPQFSNAEGKHIDAGIRYKQVTIFFIPVWNYDVAWCGAIRGDLDHYIDLSRDELQEAASTASITLPKEPTIPFWDAYGGKLVLGAIVIALFVFRRKSATKEAEVPSGQT